MSTDNDSKRDGQISANSEAIAANSGAIAANAEAIAANAAAIQKQTEYLHEIREGQDVHLRYGLDESGKSAFLTGEDASGTALFRLRLEYR